MMKKFFIVSMLVCSAYALTGCAEQNSGVENVKLPTQADLEADIKKIEDDPKLSPQEKQIRISGLKGQMGGGPPPTK